MPKPIANALVALMFLSLTPAALFASEQPSEDPKAVIAAFGEAIFAEKNFDVLPALMHEDYIQHNPLVPTGRDGFRTFFEAWFAASPDFKYELKQIVSEDDMVWLHGTYSGTHDGEWLGVPATGKPYAFNAVDIFRIEDGKLAEHWDVLDAYALFSQLGTIE